MFNAQCSIKGDKDVKTVRGIAKWCKEPFATKNPFETKGGRPKDIWLNMEVELPDGTSSCRRVRLLPEHVSYGLLTGNLSVRFDEGTENWYPLVIRIKKRGECPATMFRNHYLDLVGLRATA